MWRLLADNLPDRAGKVVAIDRTPRDLRRAGGRGRSHRRLAGGPRHPGPGDRVIVHLRKCIDEVAAMFGAWKMGAVVVNVNFAGRRRNWPMSPRTAGARAVIGPRNALERLTGEHARPRARPIWFRAGRGLAQGADPWAELPGRQRLRARRMRPARAGDDHLYLGLHRRRPRA